MWYLIKRLIWYVFVQAGSLEAGHLQDTSAPVSDDEVASTAATEGSAMFPLPADQRTGSGAGSESGGSNVDSVSGQQQQQPTNCLTFQMSYLVFYTELSHI